MWNHSQNQVICHREVGRLVIILCEVNEVISSGIPGNSFVSQSVNTRISRDIKPIATRCE